MEKSTIGERIRQVRKKEKLSLDKFGERIGLKQGIVSMMENGKSGVTDQTIRSICREFSVREKWLRDGSGEMLEPKSEAAQDSASLIQQVVEEFGLSELDRAILTLYLGLGEDGRTAVRQHAAKMLLDALANPLPGSKPLSEAEIEERVGKYRNLLKGAQQIEQTLSGNTETPKPTFVDFGESGAIC